MCRTQNERRRATFMQHDNTCTAVAPLLLHTPPRRLDKTAIGQIEVAMPGSQKCQQNNRLRLHNTSSSCSQQTTETIAMFFSHGRFIWNRGCNTYATNVCSVCLTCNSSTAAALLSLVSGITTAQAGWVFLNHDLTTLPLSK